ncbi:MAG: ABC transporter permease [Chloroflexota bacterium]
MNAVTRFPGQNLTAAVARFREIGILAFLIALVVAFSIRTPRFFSGGNFRDILLDISLLAIVAVGETMVIISRNIDLSVGSIVGFGALVAAIMVKDNPHLPVAVILLAGLGVGGALGLLNGLLITVGRIPAIIATLGTLFVYRGADFLVGQNWTPSGQVYSQDLTSSFTDLATASTLGIPNLIFFAAVVGVIFIYTLRYTRFGRRIYAVGGNPEAARLAGINVARTTLMVFLMSGALAGLASVLYASRFANITTTEGSGFELQVIAAVVIGGANIFGGSGGVIGTILGALLLGSIGDYLALSGLSEFWQLVVQGLIILAAVIVDALINQRLQRALRVRRAGLEDDVPPAHVRVPEGTAAADGTASP